MLTKYRNTPEATFTKAAMARKAADSFMVSDAWFTALQATSYLGRAALYISGEKDAQNVPQQTEALPEECLYSTRDRAGALEFRSFGQRPARPRYPAPQDRRWNIIYFRGVENIV